MQKTEALEAEVVALRARVAALEKLVLAVLPSAAAAGAAPQPAPGGAEPKPASAEDTGTIANERKNAPASAGHAASAAASSGSAAATVVGPPQPAPGTVPALATVAMAATRVVMHQLVLPADINQLGICTGGQVLSWIDLCAGLSAKTLAQGPCVTASVDAVHFLRPCRLGCVVIIAAMVARTFNTSMEVAVVVESEDMRTGLRHHCCSAHLTFVVRPQLPTGGTGGVGGSPPGLPRVVPTSPEHRAVWEGAEVRRQQRLERRARARQDPALRDMERVCRLQPITHREGGPTLPPAVTLNPAPSQHNSSRHLTVHPPSAHQQHQQQHLVPSQPGSQQLSRASSATQQAGAALSPHPSLQPTLQQLQDQLASFAQQPLAAPAEDHEQRQKHQHQRQDSQHHQEDGAAGPRGQRQDAADGTSPKLLSPAPSSGVTEDATGAGAADGGCGGAAGPRAGSPPTLLVPPLFSPPPPRRQRVPPGCTTAYMTQSILPQHANTLHITFGGQVMSWIEQCAYISASRLRAPSLLTAALDSLVFVRPTRVGDILYISAQVSAIFGSSLEVMVSVFGESPYAGAGSSAVAADGGGGGAGGAAGGGGGIFHCADAFMTVVAVDERHGTPVTVPFELDPREQADVLRYQGALARRAERLALRGQFAAAETTRVSLDGGHTYSPPPETSVEGGPSVLDAIPPL
ncbi:hypothetical protein HYH02_000667 [Chlamydomonas schloesseri]|uniref:HotDog ACOT-type domain-containing protein n=1 Tax=Chlamydomonas schloesseri TaxID=2026947 RepID=A0A836BDN5_9CHLO|nr:hypothetical protein HYH02_000667 [Chlamydomonas schloesseri]|eukprot:KAG2454835.1 hypothetical protein HYH02_000667 [Chlamydomonas schloesseri]